MILSEAPVVKITFNTAQDISDELLGGTISLCRETGYKQNIIMLTLLWSGFLLSSRNQLDEHGLVEDVLNCYTRSLSSLFPNLREDASLKKQVNEMLQHYWNNLNHDFGSLSDATEASAFLQIANKLNSQDDAASTYLLNKDPVAPFAKVRSVIHTNIYQILHQIDNGMLVQYRGIVQQPYLHHQPSAASAATRPQTQVATSRSAVSQAKKDDLLPWGKIAVWIIIFIIMIALMITGFSEDSAPTQPAVQEPTLAAVQEPQSGTILLGKEDFDGSELTITASGGSSCVVKLKTSSGTTRLSFYVRAGDTITVGVPAEYLYVYFASGDTWYGEKHLFGKSTSYGMDDEILDFTQYTWEYTLYPVSNGNFSETPIDPEDF